MKRQQKKGTKRLTKKMKTKLVGLLIVILLALVALIFRITYISIKSGDRYTRQVLTQSQQQYESTTVPFKRGGSSQRIFKDKRSFTKQNAGRTCIPMYDRRLIYP